jgi:GTP-binding protein HflX
MVPLSAKTGEGVDELLETVEKILRGRRIYLEKVFSYAEAGKIQKIRSHGQLLSEEYTEEGIEVKAYVPAEMFEEFYR